MKFFYSYKFDRIITNIKLTMYLTTLFSNLNPTTQHKYKSNKNMKCKKN